MVFDELPTCPGCERSIRTPDPTLDCYIDGKERAWHWSFARQVLAAWPEQPDRVVPEPPER